MHQRSKLRQLLMLAMIIGPLFPATASGQSKSAAPLPAQKNSPVGPPAPQSKHHPTLLLAFGNSPNWSVRIGLKGPERFDRAGYPPIPLEPAEVINEAAVDSWTYHAKDTQTGAAVAVHLTREACTDALNDTLTITPALGGRYSFRAAIDHAQIGSLKGCARIATDLFPKINNQPDRQDEDTKKKPPVPVSSVTKFQSPVAVAYFDSARQLIFKNGKVARTVSNHPSSGMSVSHDGKRLLFAGEDAPGPIRTLFDYDFQTSARHELLRANVRTPFWSPDDKRIAFLKSDSGGWALWIMPANNPQAASKVFTVQGLGLYGWPDEHTFLASNNESLLWVSDEGKISLELPIREVLGPTYRLARPGSFRLSPTNPDLLLASFWYLPPPGEAPLDKHEGNSPTVLLYEIKSKRRVALTTRGTWAEQAEWSRDGLQIFYSSEEPGKNPITYRIFWDGIGLQKYILGSDLVVGQ